VDESASLTPINPYGKTKLACEMLIRDVCESSPSMRFALLRYFNPAGAHESGLLGESPNGTPANLFPCIVSVLSGESPSLRVFGNDYATPDGTGIRDYIHVMDLAEAHRSALVALDRHPSICVNVGTGRGYSVAEVVATFEALLGHSIPTQVHPRRSGDAPACFARTDLSASVLGWHAKRGLEDMCRDTLRWASNAKSTNRR
jgi:UDP-glucose 4-epimerase